MSVRQWPATKIATAWLVHDPEDGWEEHDNPSDAERAFEQRADLMRADSIDGWCESADSLSWGIWIPIERLRLVATAWPDDDTDEGERCRDAKWDAILRGDVERVEPDLAALDFFTRRTAAAREEVEALRAERDALQAEVERLRTERPRELAAAEIGFASTVYDGCGGQWTISYIGVGAEPWSEGLFSDMFWYLSNRIRGA